MKVMGKRTFISAVIAVALAGGSAFASDSFAELDREAARIKQPKSQQIEEFHAWLDAYLDEYEAWRDNYTANLDKERASLIEQWGSGDLSDATVAVDYSEGNTVKKVVDYENNTATVSVLVDADADVDEALAGISSLEVDGNKLAVSGVQPDVEFVDYSAEQEAKEKQFVLDHVQSQMRELDVQAERLVQSNTGIPASFIYERAYKKKLAIIQSAAPRISAISQQFQQKRKELGIPEPVKPAETTKTEPTAPVPVTPVPEVAKEVVTAKAQIDKNKSAVNVTEINDNVEEAKKPKEVLVSKVDTADVPEVKPEVVKPTPEVQKPTVSEKPSEQLAQVAEVKAKKKVVSYKVNLPQGALKERASAYQPLVETESERWDIDAALVMAIMHSESSFRPDAKSHVPAYGLMQVVPTSAGHDVNKQMRNIDAPMKAKDLYVPPVNVETGTAYLNILEKRYLKSITNEESRMYCVIAAYNTGAGNVAKAFNKDRSTNIRKAAEVINQMSPDEVYEHLINNLPYDETKNYLRKVNGRISLYQ